MSEAGGWPAGVVARPIDKGDVDALAVLYAAVEEAEDNGENYDADDLLEELADPDLDLAADTLALWSGDQIVGSAIVNCHPGAVETDRVSIGGFVHPSWRRRGLGRRLVSWGAERAQVLHLARNPDVPGVLQIGGNVNTPGIAELAADFGMTPARYFFSMECDLAQPIPAVTEPDGLQLVAFDPKWDEATRVAHNTAFLDHWGSNPRDSEFWKRWVTEARAFRGPMSWLLLDGDVVASYALGHEYVADTEATGIRELYVGQVGTLREYRGRGLARTVLASALAAAKADGYERASLGVDAENPTGALGLYERLGFVVRRKFVSYNKPMA
ncbi:GNAT family N-acetyltransferase [Tenggerimyces flavus]|uniref:GNAT family N-acetyltransferase n=1 Tax=Tenggerimyces flavus TaxID=1708749 RepID=A0ABV7YBJ9_9ACTN|nr:GNAT family N-acetyltransferase [Tenggerimyces flavus]MBM7783536.1 mycothiol synthase [Tenggerimyces flavus]